MQAKLATNQTITSASDTIIQFADDLDPNGWWNGSSYQFLPNVSGYYTIWVQVWWAAGAVTNNQNNIQIRKNGGTVVLTQTQILTGSG